MYNTIEETFIKESQLRRSQSLLILFSVLLMLIEYFWVFDWLNHQYWLIAFITLFIVLIFVYSFLLFYLKINNKGFSLKQAWNIPKVIQLYKQTIHDQDIEILDDILYKNNVTTKEGLKEVMYHYRALLPRSIQTHASWLSVAAFAVSVVALVLSDNFVSSKEYLQIGGLIFLIILLLYGSYCLINTQVIQLFGKTELYKRLESSVTEIYLRTLEPKEKVVIKKRKLRKYRHDKHS